jgi:hypothetical protein
MAYAWFSDGNGRSVYRRVVEPKTMRSGLACPMLVRSFAEPVQSMADGKWYDTPRDLERTYRADGNPRGEEFVSLGNEEIRFTAPEADPKKRRDDIKQAMHDVTTGNLPPEIAAIT